MVFGMLYTVCAYSLVFYPARTQKMVYIPLKVLARLERAVRKYNATRLVMPEQAERLRKAIIVTVAMYAAKPARKRAATYLSRDVRFKGWWRNWREAGLQHLEDGAMIRWCGFSKDVVFELAEEVAKDPAVASLLPSSRYWKRADATMRPTCDVLDLVVLTLREIATIGYQHQLCTEHSTSPQDTRYMSIEQRHSPSRRAQRIVPPSCHNSQCRKGFSPLSLSSFSRGTCARAPCA